MPRLTSLVYNVTFFLVCLLAFLLVFESQLVIPQWLQVAGRMHPLLLHFPITVLMLYGIWVIAAPRPEIGSKYEYWADNMLLLGAFTAAATATMGFLLSIEAGYDSDALFWHKWTGVATAFVSFAWYAFRRQLPKYEVSTKILSGVTIVVLLVAGHLGALVTHGEEFLLAPLMSEEQVPLVAMDDALVYAHVVQPILEQKCVSCHNPQKAKNELIMTSAELLAKGGKNGTPWDTTRADLGMIMRMAHLPLDDKLHMPPRGKVQLTDDELLVLESWIRRGSSFTAKVVEFPADDPLFRFAANRLTVAEDDRYEFAAADEQKIQELNNDYRIITPLSAESPALSVSFFSESAFQSSDLSDLTPIKDQIVELDASKMPVKDEDLKLIAQFGNLRKLLLNFTDITGSTLGELAKLPHLRELSLTGTPIKASQLLALKNAKELRDLYVWNTSIKPEEFKQLSKELRGVTLESGFRSDTVVMKLNLPTVVNKEQVLQGEATLTLEHPIKGAVIRYTLDDTVPDSANSPIYKDGIKISSTTTLKARAFKQPGWLGSDVMTRTFYRTTYPPDSMKLLTTPDGRYKGIGDRVLIDGVKSSRDQNSKKWIGIQQEPLVALLWYNSPITASKVSVSTMQNVGSSIFPPTKLEVWGGMEADQFKLLGTKKPPMPGEKDPGGADNLYDFEFEPTKLKYLKVVAVPLAKIPSWHGNKGNKGWVFMDEVLVN